MDYKLAFTVEGGGSKSTSTSTFEADSLTDAVLAVHDDLESIISTFPEGDEPTKLEISLVFVPQPEPVKDMSDGEKLNIALDYIRRQLGDGYVRELENTLNPPQGQR